jgi:hypothetical protein
MARPALVQRGGTVAAASGTGLPLHAAARTVGRQSCPFFVSSRRAALRSLMAGALARVLHIACRELDAPGQFLFARRGRESPPCRKSPLSVAET